MHLKANPGTPLSSWNFVRWLRLFPGAGGLGRHPERDARRRVPLGRISNILATVERIGRYGLVSVQTMLYDESMSV